MQFCPTCDNKLNMRTAQDKDTGVCKVFLYCKNCTYSRALDHTVADGMCMYRSNYSKDHPLYFRSLVNKFTPYDRTLPRSIDVPCPKEGCTSHQLQDGDAPNEVVYIRYDDENVRYLYMCCCCKTCWRTPGYQTNQILFTMSDGEEEEEVEGSGGASAVAT